ncbi:MAG: YqiA/YcfP family alpha/beta fold hydrolase, partial [Gallionella sp.]
MATNSEFAQLSSAAYQDNPANMQLPSGWTFLRPSDPNQAGYQGYAFARLDAAGNPVEIVIANRGTEPTSSLDRTADLQMVANKLPDQYQFAKQFLDQVLSTNLNATITVTGHSLGGSLAQLLAAQTGLSAVTFNPYGAKGLVSVLNARYGLSLDPNATYTNIVNHQTMLDGVSRLDSSSPFGSDQLGQMQTHVAASELPAAALVAGSALLGPESVVAFPATYVAVKFDWSHSIDRFTQEIFAPPTLTSPVAKDFVDFARTLGNQINAIEQGITSATDPVLVKLQNDFQQVSGTVGQTYQDAVNATSSAMGQVAGALTAAEQFAVKTFLDIAFGLGNKINGLEQSVSDFLTTIQNLFHQAEITRSPLVLDLNGDGVSTIAMSAGVHFDQNNNRFSELSGWVAPSDGLLVRDLNNNGQIDGGGELFGNNTTLASGQKAANGFASLAEVDANLDGTVDSTEATAGGIKIWKDTNQNGITDAGELLTLAQAGVSSLATGYAVTPTVDAQGNQHNQTGHYTAADGTSHAMDDVWFAVDTARTLEKDTVEVSAQIAVLPDLAGFGNVHSLHQAMALDTTRHLQSLVEQFMVATDVTARQAITTQLIYAWAGVENVDPASRAASMIYGNVIGDARKLASLEALLGEGYVGVWCWGTLDPNPHGQAASVLLQAFDSLVNYVTTRLARSSISYLYDSVGIAWNATTGLLGLDFSPVVTVLETKYTTDPPGALRDLQAFGADLKTYSGGVGYIDQLRKLGNMGGTAFEFQLANLGYNKITGDAGDNTLTAPDGADYYLDGGAGNDMLNGGVGADILDGGAGNDTLNGGVGNDTYLFAAGSGQDTI